MTSERIEYIKSLSGKTHQNDLLVETISNGGLLKQCSSTLLKSKQICLNKWIT